MNPTRIGNFFWPLASGMAVTLALLTGCGKSNQTAAEAAAPAAASEVTAAPTPIARPAALAARGVAPSDLPALRPEVLDLIATNRAAVIEHQIYYVVQAELSPEETAQALFVIYGAANVTDQRKVAHAVVKYVRDEHYDLIRQQLMKAELAPQVLSVFMTDTLKRGDAIKLPVLLDLAQAPGHPNQREAQQLLVAFLGQDYGANWDRWQNAVLASLAPATN